jgi:hypothetical protein
VESGAQPGNKNAAKGKEFRQALKRVMARRSGNVSAGLEKVAETLLDAADAKEQWALREIMDRIDGKPAQALIGGDDDDPAIKTMSEILLRAVEPNDSGPPSQAP